MKHLGPTCGRGSIDTSLTLPGTSAGRPRLNFLFLGNLLSGL